MGLQEEMAKVKQWREDRPTREQMDSIVDRARAEGMEEPEIYTRLGLTRQQFQRDYKKDD